MISKFWAVVLSIILLSTNIYSQQQLSKEQIMNMSIEELSDLPLEDLMHAVEILGVSSVDELFALIMNKNVSSASKSEENAFTSPLSTTVITKDEMRTYGILSLEEAFLLIPGMIVQEKTAGNYDIQMRGLNSIPNNSSIMYTENSNTLLMIDGRPMHNYGISAITMDLLPISIEDVERIEVVRGACGALYGANAVTGVINIITEKPSGASKTVSGNFQIGNDNNMIGDVAIRNSMFNGKLSAGLTLNMQHRGRTTNKLPIGPSLSDRYYVEDDALLGPTRNMNVTTEQLASWMENNQVRLAKDEEWLDLKNIDRYRNLISSNGAMSNATEPATDFDNMYDDLGTSRKSTGVNGYVTIAPLNGVKIDLTGGYHKSSALVSTVVDFIVPLAVRTSEKAYINMNANIKDLSVNIGYNAGDQNYVKGLAGFKVFEQSFNANAEYAVKLGNLAIKPGVFYEWMKFTDYLPVYDVKGEANRKGLVASGVDPNEAYKWHLEDYGVKPDNEELDRLYGFFNTETHLYSIAPSLRLDYKVGDLRLIGAFRSDKTRVPDKWNSSWQFAANYSFNDRNFIRFVYGRANRSACLINTSADYRWDKTNMMPAKIYMNGNLDADLVHIDNYELGYRWRPTDKILLDAEAFYSKAEDFGFLKSRNSMFAISAADLAKNLVACATVLRPGGYPSTAMGGYIYQNGMETRTYLAYDNVPFVAKQLGLSLNLDYIISSKLIAKLNLNVQQTKLDNYYEYSKNVGISKQLGIATQELYANLLSGAVVDDFFSIIDGIKAETGWGDQEAIIAFFTNPTYQKTFSEFGQSHHIQYEGTDLYFGSNNFEEPETENGVKHKSTPSVYGMLGLIYKPVSNLSVSAFANMMSKREYKTGYGQKELGNLCRVNMKIGYKPIQNMEIYFNAHNLLNNKAQEFLYSDKIAGTYLIGVNFGF